MKDIVLVSAGVSQKEYPRFSRFQTLAAPGIYYLKAVLSKEGHKVRVIDQPTDNLSDEQVIARINGFNPRYVLFNQFFSTRGRIRKIIANLGGNYLIGAGGHDATFNSIETGNLSQDYAGFDFIWRGEAEEGLADFLESLTEKQDQPLTGGSLVNRVNDLDTLPILTHDDYSGDTGFLVTSRGCFSKGCDFCTTPPFYKDGWRSRGVSHVSKELENLAKNGKKYVMITDDNFLGFQDEDFERAAGILQRSKDLGLKLMFLTMSNRLLKAEENRYLDGLEGTIFRVFLGVENGDPSALKKLGKCCKYEIHAGQSKKAIHLLYTRGIAPLMGYINFNPDTTFEELEISGDFLYQTMEAAKFVNLSQELRVFEGTRILEKFKREGRKFDVVNGVYRYPFADSKVGDFLEYLKPMKDTTDEVDHAVFNIEELVSVNQLQNTPLGKQYWDLRKRTNEINYQFYIDSLNSFKNSTERPDKDKFLGQLRKLIEEYTGLHSRICAVAEHV